MSYLYLIINLFTISGPMTRSFEPQIHFISRWKSLLLAILLPMVPFIAWDMLFTAWGVWGFNPAYLSGINLGNLPLEEWLFFVTVPYACMFIYEVMNLFVKKDIFKPIVRPLSFIMILFLFGMGINHLDKWYTSVTFIAASFYLIFLRAVKVDYLGRFFLAYLVSLIPFLLVNGVLTGSFIQDQIVWYNDAENLSVRIGTIPVEDTVYALLLLMMNVSVYEYFNRRFSYSLVRERHGKKEAKVSAH